MPAKKNKNRKYLYTAGAILLSIAFLLLFIDPPFLRPEKKETFRQQIPPLRKDAMVRFLDSADGRLKASVEVQVAEYENDRMQGMMFRKKVGENEGMLFIFERSEPRSFWMKNTFIPLDIIYADENLVITTIHHRTEPLSTAPIRSKGNARYVVETQGGFCEKNNISEGDRITVDRYGESQ